MADGVQGEELEERLAIEAVIAGGIAELSETTVTPIEVDVRSPFKAGQVQFSGGAFLAFVARVQDWLRLAVTIDTEASPVIAATQLFEGLGVSDVSSMMAVDGDLVVVTDAGLDRIRDRVDRALDLKEKFLEAVETGSLSAATTAWIEDWEDGLEQISSGPVVAKAITWMIQDFAGRAARGRLELNPPYQRSDVWPTPDAQLLIESILRGIPLPSIIMLKPRRDGEAPFEVVDGKQRLTAMLRFIGAHPKALKRVEDADRRHPGARLKELFETDYAKFRKVWNDKELETLTTTLERKYYFPFKVSASSKALTGDLEALAGKYYHAIQDERVIVGGESVDVRTLFTSATEYMIPVIVFTEATPRQIHEVFSLYNRQGKHLNAEEIRNAVYHELALMRALSVSAGDQEQERMAELAPFLLPMASDVIEMAKNLKQYNFGDARYRLSKVLSWVVSLLVAEPLAEGGKPRLLSTAQHINGMLTRIQESPSDPLRNESTIRDLLSLVGLAMEAHAGVDPWAPKFKDNEAGAKWQELQLVASVLGVCMAASVLGESITERLIDSESRLRDASLSPTWARPAKTQTGIQWQYISRVALGILEILDVPITAVESALRSNYGYSGTVTLLKARDDELRAAAQAGGTRG